jgi:cell division protein FtsW
MTVMRHVNVVPQFLRAVGQRVSRLWGADQPEAGIDVLPVRVQGTEFTHTTASPVHVKGFDQPLVWVTFALLMFGLVMVYSASIAIPDNPRMGAGYTPTHFLMRHAMSLFVAFVAALFAFQVPLNTWERVAPWVFVVSIVLLIAVLMPFIGKSVNGARRWIGLGFMNFQPSELASGACCFTPPITWCARWM